MSIAGIRIGVDVSWFLVLFFIIFTLSGSFRNVLDSSDTTAYITAVAAALLLFASLVVHELGHALVARRNGIEVEGIDLFLFGGLARLSRESRTPGEEFRVAAAGPAATLLVIVAGLGACLAIVGPDKFVDAALLRSSVHITPALLTLTWLVNMNIVIFIFNLVPAFPLDGGRIARAAVWRLTHDQRKGTRFAALLGTGFAYLLGGFGFYLLLANGTFDGLWLIVLAVFVGSAARAANLQSAFSERLDGVTVQDIMDTQPVSVPSDISVERARDEFFLRYRWSWFPVTDGIGRFIGLVREAEVDGAPDSLTIARVMDSEAAESWRVAADSPIEDLLGSEGLRENGALMAVDREGVLRGVVTVEQVRRALQSALTPSSSS